MENKMISPMQLLKKSNAYKKQEPSLTEIYKDSIIVLKNEKNLSLSEIEKFLNENNINIKKHQLSKFFKSLNENIDKK